MRKVMISGDVFRKTRDELFGKSYGQSQKLNIHAQYTGPAYKFRWLDKMSGGAYQVLDVWHECRETFSARFKVVYDERYNFSSSSDKGTLRYMDRRKFRVLVHVYSSEKKTLDDFEGDIKTAKRIVNIFEKYLGWSLTTVREAKDKEGFYGKSSTKMKGNNRALGYVFVASSKWMRSPQLISLYLLLIRLGRLKDYLKDFKAFSDLHKVVEKIKGKDSNSAYADRIRRELGDYQTGNDASYLCRMHEKLPLILDNVKEVFFKSTRAKNFRENAWNWGITSLLNSDRASKDIISRWKDIEKKHRDMKKMEAKN
jgi:hypothetical protein